MRVFYLLLTIGIGLMLNAPFHNFQDLLAQGDHGRDLYAAQAVLKGDMPYKDFWWVYGPLMPYYYALCFKTLGTQIASVLLGKAVLNVAAGAFFFLAFAQIFPAVAAVAAAVWFMAFHQDFFFTYNHAGGIALILCAMWQHLGYIRCARQTYAWGALLAVLILGLIKINFAIVALLMTLAVVAWQSRLHSSLKLFYTSAVLLVPLAWLGIYAWFTSGLSAAEIRQCLPYLGGDEPYNKVGLLQTIPILVGSTIKNIGSSWTNLALCAIVLLCGTSTLQMLFTGKLEAKRGQIIWLTIGYAVVFYMLNLHEFLKSGVFYRSFWSQPFSMLLMFTVIACALAGLKSWMRGLLWGALALIVALGWWSNYKRIETFKTPQHYLGSSRGGVYVTNDRAWLQTVVLTTKQLGVAFKKNELFLALPYDCLYYYLTDKKSPTRQLIFFDHIKISPDQEQSILAELDRHATAGILVSTRQSAREHGLGTLGVTYCPLIAQYINTSFTPVAKLGDWVNEPGWAWGHGTLILKRKETAPPPLTQIPP